LISVELANPGFRVYPSFYINAHPGIPVIIRKPNKPRQVSFLNLKLFRDICVWAPRPFLLVVDNRLGNRLLPMVAY
jgi:hypothetical protein